MPVREQRGVFRVTVKPRSGLQASLNFAGRVWAATVRDVSSEGISIKLAGSVLPALTIDSRVDVEVTFDDETLVLHGVIRSHRDGGYGIFVPERDRRGQINPRAKLAKISTHLQRADLAQRVKVLKPPE